MKFLVAVLTLVCAVLVAATIVAKVGRKQALQQVAEQAQVINRQQQTIGHLNVKVDLLSEFVHRDCRDVLQELGKK